jgi:core binding factor beta subunit
MVGYSSLFGSVLGLVTKNIEQLCEERNRSSHFLPSFRDQKPETTVKEAWTDMRPLSLRKKMEEMAKNPLPPPPLPDPNRPQEKSLVERLCEGDHPVEASLRPEKTVKLFKEAIDRNYVHIKFTKTRGGTELGVRLDREACGFSQADFDHGHGTIHVEGNLTLDYVKVRCVADIDLATLEGKGHLEKVEAQTGG